ncbi:MAG TPA: protein-L-isoaspartate(D-aspartate) O-methyltransferase [Gammaproteobacteria bacterium]|nr:protein-L-isoaspartate(D-aspartate) O-methyltransferase [Pseudomonadales bacterium]MDC0374191.1 protein-L-isoaspartate(D-aspartate) O-methyltransferase [Pseudomonadales bacterium]MDC1366867.1 protein-L-isoaspartate(D-aspartate) O-methyltransferase [Pseudomonadales bacterium]HAF37774.1 protein-L-isoaspartate(D-aspartate) O-methyltransferase [Gammaproteobacteria bacterium]HAJ30349.1 protein-L-isoaspartate(D-aspartate) O-methyltransferase [Gammaproteobacteria bacterium]
MTSQRTRNRLTDRLREQGIVNEAVLQVMASTPRHLFVDEALAHRAYEDTALPIGNSQTISQPYIVARMTELLLQDVPPTSVLEVGTGSGYQTAILAQLMDQVFTVERISALLDRALGRFRQLGLHQIKSKYDDGHLGWAEKGPFDAIIVTASPREVPAALLAQLRAGGRLIIPVGDAETQTLTLVTRRDDGFETTLVEPVRFVPLLGGKL